MNKDELQKAFEEVDNHTAMANAYKLEQEENPGKVVDTLYTFSSIEACAILNLMSPLGAALVLGTLKLRGERGNEKALEIFNTAKTLEIRGFTSAVAALDETIELLKRK